MENHEQELNLKSIEQEYQEFVQAAEKEYPNISKDVQVFTSHKIELQSYQEYLDLVNQTPDVFVSNTASPA